MNTPLCWTWLNDHPSLVDIRIYICGHFSLTMRSIREGHNEISKSPSMFQVWFHLFLHIKLFWCGDPALSQRVAIGAASA